MGKFLPNKNHFMQHDFFASHAIGDSVLFRPMFRQQQEMGIDDEVFEGEIVAVRFTKSKVFYDVLSAYHGKIFSEVDSSKVWSEQLAKESLPEAV